MSSRRPPKDHKLVIVDLDHWRYDNMLLDEVIEDLRGMAGSLLDPQVEFAWGDPQITGFEPMNELEIMQAEARRKASRAANAAKKAKKEAEERGLLEKLKAKYE